MEMLLDYMQEMLGFSERTRNRYEISLKKYTNFHNMTLEELLEEAEAEEDNGVKKRKRKINNRLISFKKHMETTTYTNPINGKTGKYSANTIINTFKHIHSFYNCFEIYTPKIKNMPTVVSEKYSDTITKEIIQEVLSVTPNLKHRAIIIAMAVSGLDGDTLRKLKWDDFLHALDDYHTGRGSVHDLLKELLKAKAPVAMFQEGVRGKTQYEHIFFFNPEAVHAVCRYGLELEEPLRDDIIFKISLAGFTRIFSRLNDRLNLGKTSRGTRRKFHAHGLRNYLGTTLLGTTYDGMMLDSLMIEFMLGHAVPPTTAAYYKRKPEALKETYIKVMPKLSLEKVNVRDIDSPAYKRMEAKLAEYEKLEHRIVELEKLKNLYSNKDNMVLEKTYDLEHGE